MSSSALISKTTCVGSGDSGSSPRACASATVEAKKQPPGEDAALELGQERVCERPRPGDAVEPGIGDADRRRRLAAGFSWPQLRQAISAECLGRAKRV